ncbi:outer membrane beta-barrel protein [Flavobacterium salilacus subsp. salilacus]|uniref:TonB-dependent receptor n=1 Tax=Flavobacterium TaxID=237 RepID=UPI0010755E37|nr:MULTISPECIES: TonB-dependent receptor [Flavobacterium]KAF2520194.1 outer membrane beta-barrel protein [Flavobacterium salilacus subsp. salilacus]MBE1613889.1 TonB-dependent receptor [Flavobacterium sp. SaA2.13]
MKYIFILFLCAISAFSQSTINGKVSDESTETLSGASILLKSTTGQIITYTITDKDGGYTLEVESGSYTLEANYLGYQKQSLTILLKDKEKRVQNFTLKLRSEELKEVVIKYEQPVVLRGDTLVFDAKALSTGSEVVVEDLLKNIPGIVIEKDGTIKYNDRPIEKVMVDGDDLFNKGYSLLTRNMPNKPLDKVEVLQNYSNNKLLKGIEDSNAVALNLTIDEAYKNLWFGNIEIGYGERNRYLATGNLMHFAEKYKTFLTTSFNNAGYDKTGNVDAMVSNSVDLESIGHGYRASKIMGMGIGSSRLGEDRTRFNNAEVATLSTIFPLSDNAKLKLIGFLGFDEQDAFHNSYSVTDFQGTFFENSEINNSRDKLSRSYVNALFNYDVSATQMVQSSTTFNAGKSDYKNDYTFNGTSTRETLETKNTYFDQKATYTHKWNDRNIVLLKTRFFTDKLPQNYGINDYLLGDLFASDTVDAVGNDVKSNKEYAGLQADFRLKQKNDDLISFAVGYDYNNDDLTTRFSLFAGNNTTNPADFQSDISYSVGDLYARSGYTFKFKQFSLGGTVNIHQLFNRFQNSEGDTKTQNPFIVNPTLNASWRLNPDNIFSAMYSYNVTNSDLLQVNDSYLLTSSRSFSRGLGYFNQWESSNASLDFTTKHYLNRYQFSAGLSYSRQNDVVTYRSQLDQNTSLSDAFIIRGGDRIGVRFSSHYVIRKLKGTVKLEGDAGRAIYYNQYNNSGLRKNTSYHQSFTLGWGSNFKSAFNFNIATEWDFSQVKSDNTFRNTSKFSYLDLKYVISENFNVQLKTEHYNFGGVDSYNNYFFADLEALYSFEKQKYSIGLDGRNLFDTNVFTTYSVSDIGYSTNSYRLLPRYVLMTFKYRF